MIETSCDRRYDHNVDDRHDDVINVTPSSFSDIFIKPRIAAGMVLVKKKTTDATLETTTTTTPFFSTTASPVTTTALFFSTTTTPLVLVKKTTTTTTTPGEKPILVVGPNSALSFKNVKEESETGHLLHSLGIAQGEAPALDSWSQGKMLNHT